MFEEPSIWGTHAIDWVVSEEIWLLQEVKHLIILRDEIKYFLLWNSVLRANVRGVEFL